MRQVSVREARTGISRLLTEAEKGEAITISRRGKPVARLVPIEKSSRFSDRGRFRAGIPAAGMSSAELLRKVRDEERF